MCVERLTATVRDYQRRTGEESLLVVLHDGEDRISGIHHIGYEPAVGLMVDGRPASCHFYWQLQDFHPLQEPPTTLH